MDIPETGKRPLAGQIAVVTGASRGIGRSIAIALAAAGAAHVALAARDEAKLHEAAAEIRSAGGRASVHSYRAEDPRAARALAEQVETDHGRIDLLVNNAGMNGPGLPFVSADIEGWWRVFEVNLRAPAMLCHAALPGMLRRKAGRIINVSSGLGNFVTPNTSDYSVSKTALTRFTEAIAAELRGSGVNAFAISPGMVKTDMTRSIPDLRNWTDWDPPEAAGALCVAIASGRLDRLAGRFLGVREGVEALVDAADRIIAEDMQVLRMNRMPLREG